MADLLELDAGDPFRVRAFRRIGKAIENLAEPLAVIRQRSALRDVPGIGEGGEYRVKQILRSGQCDELVALRKRVAPELREMLRIAGLGPKRVRMIYSQLRISTLDQLRQAAASGMLDKLPRMGEQSARAIVEAIDRYREATARVPLAEALRRAAMVGDQLAELAGVSRVTVAGSARRRRETIGDLDILVATDNPRAVTARFVTLPQVAQVVRDGNTFAAVRLSEGQQVDLVALPPREYGAALHYFTGSQLHNIQIRLRANRAGFKVSEHGVFRLHDDLRVGGEDEREVFAAAGLPAIPAELREDAGEIEAAERGQLPQLVERADLLGDLHMHSAASDGSASIEQMALAARARGHRYIAITDHSRAMTIANGLDERRLRQQIGEVRRVNARIDGIEILAGVEVDILADGQLDLDCALLAELDWVVASVHSDLGAPAERITQRILCAIESGVVDCIGHPSGRRLGLREGSALDLDAILDCARRHDVALECNGSPARMDLDSLACRRAREYRVPIVINSDAHTPAELEHQSYALFTARRGWLEAKDVLNCFAFEQLRQRRRARIKRVEGLVLHAQTVTLSSTGEPYAASDGEGALEPGLAAQLERLPISAALQQRLIAFLRGEPDTALADALGDNPLQRAFALVATFSDDDPAA